MTDSNLPDSVKGMQFQSCSKLKVIEHSIHVLVNDSSFLYIAFTNGSRSFSVIVQYIGDMYIQSWQELSTFVIGFTY